MVDHVLIDALKSKPRTMAERWRDQIRKAPQLKSYNAKTDEELVAMDEPLYGQLARMLERGVDRSVLGGFFVQMGKDRMAAGFSISETVFALNIARKVVIEFLEYGAEIMLDNPVQLYQTIDLSSRVAEFFFLGCFYLTKGFLESIYVEMNESESVSESLLKKYFNDDFFFKK